MTKHRADRQEPVLTSEFRRSSTERADLSDGVPHRPDDRQWRNLVEQIPAVTYTERYDTPGHYAFVSPQVEALCGFTPEEVIGQPGLVASRVHPDDLALFMVVDEHASESGEPFRLEFRLQTKDGRWIWVRSEAVLVHDGQGRPLYWQGVLVDISDRKTAEAQLWDSEARFRTVLAAAPVGIVVHDASGAIVAANEAAESTLGLSQDQLRGLTSLDPRWRAIHPDGSPFPGAEHPGMVSLRTGKPCDDVTMGICRTDGSRVWLSVNSRPLIKDGDAAPYAAVTSFVDLTERFELESALRESERRFRLMVQDSYDIITVVDRDGRRRYVSPAIFHALGYEPRELEGVSALTLVHPEDAPGLAAALAECVAGLRQTPVLDLRFQHRDGTWRQFEAVATNFLDEPAIGGIVFNSRDVSERKTAEAALRDSEAQFRSMFEGAGIATALVGPDGIITLANPALAKMLGYTQDELIGMSVQDISYPEDSRAQQELRRRMWAGELDSYELEKQYRKRDGSAVWGQLHTVALRDAEGKVRGALGQIQDISARKETEEALRESEARLQALIHHVPVALYRQEGGSGKTTYVSPQWATMLGLDGDDVPIGLPALLDRMHPADRDIALRAADAAQRDGVPFDVEYRLRHEDGHWLWIRDHSHVERDADGHPAAWTGVLIDVTERKRLTASLRESQERFRRAFEDAPIGMSIGDRAGICIDANAAYCAILGRPREAIIGHPFAEFTHPDDLDEYGRAHARLIAGGIPVYQLEKRYQRPDGAIVTGLLTASVIHDESGAFLYDIGQLEDISERKRLEAAARESDERFRVAFARAPIGLAMVEPDGKLRQVNQALCDLLGYTEEGLLATGFSTLTHADDLEDDGELGARLWAGEIESYQLEKRLLHRDGRALWCQLTASVGQNAAGERYGIVQIQDISSRRDLDIERAIMLASEREYARQLRELTEMRTNLTAMVAHELGAPISALRVMTAMLETGELSPEATGQTYGAIQDQLNQLDRLVADVAAAATAERDDFPVQFLPVSLPLLLGGAATIAQTMLAGHPFEARPAPNVRVWCDPERISQVLRNVIGNVAKHTPHGTPVTLSSRLEGEWVRIEIADGGPGIAREDLGRIFEKFGRGQETAGRGVPGVGLGLYLSRRIIEEHGGELTVESIPGRGATFRFSLRVAA